MYGMEKMTKEEKKMWKIQSINIFSSVFSDLCGQSVIVKFFFIFKNSNKT